MPRPYMSQPRGEVNGFEIIAHSDAHLTVCTPLNQHLTVRGIPYDVRIECHYWPKSRIWNVGREPADGRFAMERYDATYVRRADWLQRGLRSSDASRAATETIQKLAIDAATSFARDNRDALRRAGFVALNNRAHYKEREIEAAQEKLAALLGELADIEAGR